MSKQRKRAAQLPSGAIRRSIEQAVNSATQQIVSKTSRMPLVRASVVEPLESRCMLSGSAPTNAPTFVTVTFSNVQMEGTTPEVEIQQESTAALDDNGLASDHIDLKTSLDPTIGTIVDNGSDGTYTANINYDSSEGTDYKIQDVQDVIDTSAGDTSYITTLGTRTSYMTMTVTYADQTGKYAPSGASTEAPLSADHVSVVAFVEV